MKIIMTLAVVPRICIINQHDALSFSLDCVTTPLHVSGPFVARHKEAECTYNVANGIGFTSKSTVARPSLPGPQTVDLAVKQVPFATLYVHSTC
jgi:hypothetical protein